MIIIILLIILLYLSNYINENFTYFNLNLDIINPKSVNTNNNYYYDINFPISNYNTNNNISDSTNNNISDSTNNYISDNRIRSAIFDNRIKFININNTPYTNTIKTSNLIDSSNCCLIQKKFDSGTFSYIYTKLKDDKCNSELYELDQNNQLLFDGVNNWSNNNCSLSDSELGSCRIANLECIDFITQDDCLNITYSNRTNQNNDPSKETRWSNKTCQDKIY